jgi:hypothetical protein
MVLICDEQTIIIYSNDKVCNLQYFYFRSIRPKLLLACSILLHSSLLVSLSYRVDFFVLYFESIRSFISSN